MCILQNCKKIAIVLGNLHHHSSNRTKVMSSTQACQQKVMSFAEVVQGRDASVRVTPEGLLYAVDLVAVITNKDKRHASEVCFRTQNES